jgi:hypothetical protein
LQIQRQETAEEMSKKEKKAEVQADPLHEHREAFKALHEAWKEDQKRYVEDVKFIAGDQWHQKDKDARDADGRPCLTVDKLNQYVKQVVNDSRQNRPSVKVRPVDSGADVEAAEIFQGMIRHIEDRSNADVAYDTAMECATKGGFGFFRIAREYAGENTFNQELAFKRVRNPLSVLFDRDCQEPDGSDARRVFIWEDMPEDEFAATYPNAEKVDWDAITGEKSEWYSDKKIRVAETYWIELEEATLHLLADGSIVSDEEVQAAKAEGIPVPEILGSRQMQRRVVWWAKINGKEYLEGPTKEPGKWIPVVPVWGNEVDIEGKVIHSGMIHPAKDAQRLYNYSRTAFAERISRPGTYVAADGQVEDYIEEWDGTDKNVAVKRYSPIDVAGNPLPPPRLDATDIPASLVQDMQMSEHDIQGALGMYNASLGEKSNEKSGRAIMARQREGDMANFHYHDNLARAIRHAGRILVDLIPKIYDTSRVVRVLGLDGKADMIQIDPSQEQAVKKIGAKAIYNLGVGTYDVSVSVGPSYTTQRQEAVAAMGELFQGNPQMMQLIGDLFFRSQDWPMAEEIADRLKLMLPPQIAEAENKEADIPPEAQAMVKGMQQQMEAMQQGAQAALAERDQALQEAGQQLQDMQQQLAELQVQSKGKEGETEVKAREAEIKAFEAETERLKVEREFGIDAINDLLREHEAKVKEIVAACQPQQVEGEPLEEAEPQPDMLAMIQASHDQTMQAIAMIAEAMTKPKTMQIQTPSGATYTGQVQ